MSRPSWVEWEGKTPRPLEIGPEVVVLTVLGHPDSIEELRATLVTELAQSGIAESTGVAYAMSNRTVLTFGWYGFIDEDTEPVWCDGAGMTVHEDWVDRALPCVYAVLVR